MKLFCFLIIVSVGLLNLAPAHAIDSSSTPILNPNTKTVPIATYQWQPYISGSVRESGTAAELLGQIFSQEDINVEWRYQNYDLAFEMIASGKAQGGFPYFKTAERASRVLFSKPIFSVTNRIYYNRQHEQGLPLADLAKLKQFKFGRVAGYSYGETIDSYLQSAQIFASEKSALEALLNHEIDFLPMTESVMNTMLNNQFKDQALLVRSIDSIIGHDTMHLIAPKTKQGELLRDKVNSLIEQVKNIKSLSLKVVERTRPKDIARLVTAEGYPAIVGQTSLDENSQYYTLPQGTRVLVLKWSNKIVSASQTDRIYKSMIDLSQVVVLNGPHVGKELFIKNMHLEIQ